MIISIKGRYAVLIILLIWGYQLQGRVPDSLHFSEEKTAKRLRLTVLPAGGFEPETSVKLGLTAFALINRSTGHEEPHRPSTISSYFLYTFNHQVLSKIKWRLFLGNTINITSSVQYFDYPEQFFGIGNDVQVDQSEQLVNRFFSFNGNVYKRLTIYKFIGLSFDLQYNWLSEVPNGSNLLMEEVNGIQGGRTIGLGPAFKYDTRNNIIYPTRGSRFESEVLIVSDFIGSEYSYVNYRLDYRKFFHFKNERNVIALQSSLKLTTGDEVPFYKLPKLGGIHRLRGIQSSQLYRDKQAVYIQAEYRRDLFWRFGGTLFAGTGDVAPRIRDLEPEHFKYVLGAGLRFAMISNEKLNLRLDWGMGPSGQSAFYIAIREAF